MGDALPPYSVKRSARSRHVRIRVSAGGRVQVTAPMRVLDTVIEGFMQSKLVWLTEKIEYFKKIPEQKWTRVEEKKMFIQEKERAQKLAQAKVFRWNSQYNFKFGRISIRNSRTRWGSCSSKGTLSFNYKIVFLPEHLADYLVVHELCHLKEHNHSKNFWLLVAQTMGEYKILRRELRDFDKTFKLPLSVI